MLAIGVTTNNPDSGPLSENWDGFDGSDQYWYVEIVVSVQHATKDS